MKTVVKANMFSVGLAIFSMFFGAGNLLFAVNLGREFQSQTPVALLGFVITGVFLPILGVFCILAFEGDYKSFFQRLGKWPGFFLCFSSIFIMGPLVAMPRIVTFSHAMFAPFATWLSLPVFAFLFLLLTFLFTIKESKIIDFLGYIVSPLLLLSLLAIFLMAYFDHPGPVLSSSLSSQEVFLKNLVYGYNTLDFLTSIFFGSVVLSILLKSNPTQTGKVTPHLIKLGLKSSFFGLSLLAFIYVMLAWIGARYGNDLGPDLNLAQSFQAILTRVLGDTGSFLMAICVFLACFSTVVALAVISAEFIQKELSFNRLSYGLSLFLALLITFSCSLLGIQAIVDGSMTLITILYPALIALSVCNILFKKFHFSYVKPVVGVTLFISVIMHFSDRLL